jgi:hypothetical protein
MDMVATPHTLLLILMDVAAEHETEFERWNEEEHIAERLAVPGFLSASRYRLAPDARTPRPGETAPRPRHLTLYELAGPEVLRSAAYAQATGNPTERTRRMAPQLDVRVREVYVRTGATAAPENR